MIEFVRYSSLIVLLLGYASLLVGLFVLRKPRIRYVLLGALLYFAFLIFYQRLNEDRYFLPVLTIGFLALAILTFTFSEQFRKMKKEKP